MVCLYLEIEEDPFIYFRDGQSILDTIDPVQLMIPTPKSSKAIDKLEKEQSIIILNEILNAAAN